MTSALEPTSARSFGALWPAEDVRRRRLGRYAGINAAMERPLALQLSRRGFFSEVNIAIGATLFALTQGRRLAVSQSGFNGLRWEDYFASTLPVADPALIASTPPEALIAKPKAEAFRALLAWIAEAAETKVRFRIEALEIEGDLFQAKRALFQLFCRPTPEIEAEAAKAMRQLQLRPGRFAAVHLRRGDKVAQRIKNGRPWSEGEKAPPEQIARLLEALSPSTREVLVLTDDFAAVGELEAACPGRRVVSLCPPGEAGHDQETFNAAPLGIRTATVRRLVAESVIAAQSDAFAGGFKSNVAKFIASIHADPRRCASTDALAAPWPYH